MPPSLEDRVRTEVESLHRFFVGWFSGSIPESEFQRSFLDRFDPGLIFIPPAGSLLGLDDLASSVRRNYGTNPDFRIAIRAVTLRRRFDSHVVATYEEWQRNALASKPPENARIATVLFEDTEPLRWVHIHETWMPADISAAGPYDF